MGNCWKKFYYSLPKQETCPYCKKKKFISEQETAFKISTSGCRVCRIKMKYFHDSNHKFIRKPSYDRIYDCDTFNNIRNTRVKGRYY
jgi:hypothetical protein